MEQEALSMTDNQSRKRRRNKAKPGDKLEARRQSMTGVDLLGSGMFGARIKCICFQQFLFTFRHSISKASKDADS